MPASVASCGVLEHCCRSFMRPSKKGTNEFVFMANASLHGYAVHYGRGSLEHIADAAGVMERWKFKPVRAYYAPEPLR